MKWVNVEIELIAESAGEGDGCVLTYVVNTLNMRDERRCVLDYQQTRELIDQLLCAICETPLKVQLEEERSETVKDAQKFLRDGLRSRGFDVPDTICFGDVLNVIDSLKGKHGN